MAANLELSDISITNCYNILIKISSFPQKYGDIKKKKKNQESVTHEIDNRNFLLGPDVSLIRQRF